MYYQAGLPSTCGSAIRRDFVPDITCTVVERLSQAGAYTFAGLNMAEFAMPLLIVSLVAQMAGALSLAIEARLFKEQAGFDALLSLFDSTISFHAQYQQSRTPQALTELLVTSSDNPRSLAWVAQTLRSRLRRIEHLADGATHALAALLPPTPTEPTLLWPQHSATPEALQALLAQYRQSARAVAEGLSGLFFTHSGPAAHSVSV